MRIQELVAYHVRIPLRSKVKHASHTRTDTDSILVCCRLDDGSEGWGEGLPREYVTGETIDTAVELFRSEGGGGELVAGGMKVCWGKDEQAARATAYRLWRNEQLPGELAQILPTPAHFEQANELVSAEMVAEAVPCGPDLDRHVEVIQRYADAGFDELYIQQVGPEQERFFEVYAKEVLPRFTDGDSARATLASTGATR